MIQKHVELGRRIRDRLSISPLILTLFRMGGGGGGKKVNYVTSSNVEIRPQNFLTFIFNPFDRLV